MALQHFYSRVPAKVSMYKKSDGFDTFAQSASLEPEFVERELAYVYENKLSKNDIPSVLRNQMPYIYTQSSTRSGLLVQNKITFIPLDYTGERSAYMSHSLIFNEDEKKNILSTSVDETLNPSLFTAKIDDFCLLDSTSTPKTDYPSIEYSPAERRENGYVLSELDEEPVKAFLYAVLNSVCGKGKNVCFKFSEKNEYYSELSVQIFNELLSILPYRLREDVSFASYVTDPSQYSNFKIRGVAEEFPETTPKCICIDLKTGLVVGLRVDELVTNKNIIDFFYSLLNDETLRKEFLKFTSNAIEAIPSLRNMNFKVLNSLVFLFECCCGMMPAQSVMPDDNSIYEYLCAYEKYRSALPDEYRVRGYRYLLRYRENHLAIPKNIFAKVSRLYGAELPEAKRIVMAIVLDLIHIDVMREKLFAFINNYYTTETTESKEAIVNNLTRVFYGGFLQSKLLNFFSEHFDTETEPTKTLIFEKLLLSIRTPAVQQKIIEFIKEHHSNMSVALKTRYYETFFEMLPECDSLSVQLVKLTNKLIPQEPSPLRAAIASRITDLLESDYRHKEHNLLPILATEQGFCQDCVMTLAFGAWKTRMLSKDYLAHLQTLPLTEKAETLLHATETLDATAQLTFFEQIITLFDGDIEQGDLHLWLDIEEKLDLLPAEPKKPLVETIVIPAVCRTLREAFDTTTRTDGLRRLETFAEKHPELASHPEYSVIETYNTMLTAESREDLKTMATCLSKLMSEYPPTTDLATHLSISLPADKIATAHELRLWILRGMLRTGSPELSTAYKKLTSALTPEPAMETLLSVCLPLATASEEMQTALSTGIDGAISAFITNYGKGASAWLANRVPQDDPFRKCIDQAIKTHKKENGTLFSRIFRFGK